MKIYKTWRYKKLKTNAYIEKLKRNFVRISTKQEKAIIDYWGANIDDEHTEQDVWEQTRKVINNA